MPTWQGWEDQLLTAAAVPRVGSNRSFLDVWAQHASSNCANNPVDISHRNTGSVNCHKLTSTRTAQRYTSHARAASAFAAQLHSGNFPDLASGFLNGSLLTSNATAAEVAELQKWGSVKFAAFVSGTSGGGGGGGGGGVNTPSTHKGWEDMRRSLNKRWHPTLTKLNKLNAATLRDLHHASKVRL